MLTLFPQEERRETPFPAIEEQDWDDTFQVTECELLHLVKRIKEKKAPGPNGIPGKVVKMASGVLTRQMAHIFTQCLKEGFFPETWKEAIMVLLPKTGKPKSSSSAYRPICLLGEVGKFFERIIANRLVAHLANTEGCSLSQEQYGFRQGRSTVDAIESLRRLKENLTEEEGIVLAVSLDVANAFKSIPWSEIAKALKDKGVPSYIYNVMRSYFEERYII